MALGEELRHARMRKKLTASQVAADTRMKVQTVEALEREDFSRIAAPIYAKGFIKLFAEYVGLDPQPLIEDYVHRFVAPPPAPSPAVEELSPAPVMEATDMPAEDAPESAAATEPEPDLFAQVDPEPERRGILVDQGYRAAPPSVWDSVADGLQGLGAGARSGGAHAARWTVSAVTAALAAVRRGWQTLWNAFKARRLELKQIDYTRLSARHLLALLAVLVLVLFVASSLTRCVRRPGKMPASTDGLTDEIPLAAEPSDLYLD